MIEPEGRSRTRTLRQQLVRAGFDDVARAEQLLASPTLSGVLGPDAVDVLRAVADPNLAVLSLTRILEHPGADRLSESLRQDAGSLTRLLRVLGVSQALGDHLVRHPDHWVEQQRTPAPTDRRSLRERMLGAVGADPLAAAPVAGGTREQQLVALRVEYRRAVLQVATDDVVDGVGLAETSDVLAHVADAVLESALAIARATVGAESADCRLAVIAMGKCGGEELNYISDVDVVFVVDSVSGDESGAIRTGTRLASELMRACMDPTPEGDIWEVDANLRPEGRSGALVRTLDSHVGYYERWAQTWEFQALLKARPAAGDSVLGQRYVDSIRPMVWEAAGRDNFVPDVQAMRRRVERSIKGKDAQAEIKLGPGGLRDVEFSVQLLQLVHGRGDPSIRQANTLGALERLAAGGYVGRQDAEDLTQAYRFLRTLEHRIQLHRLARTHQMPRADADVRRLGRSLGFVVDPVRELRDEWKQYRKVARRLHEKLFYRPLLGSVARLEAGEVRLAPDAARDRLRALGFIDPEAALGHLRALTAGVSRRAAIQRTLLPVMLGWFADSPDPDGGLFGFRRVSDSLGATPWYLRLLRDESTVADRLAHLLGSSKYAADLLLGTPESVSLLQQEDDMLPRSREVIERAAVSVAARHQVPEKAINAVRGLRRRELFRIAAGDALGVSRTEQVAQGLSDLAGATLGGALHAAVRSVAGTDQAARSVTMLVVAMGRLGGAEIGYASDADVMFVYDSDGQLAREDAAKQALQIANEMRRLLTVHGPDPGIEVDATLRPEGRNGPLVRSIESYQAYYQRWSSPWEAQALLRAAVACGEPELGRRFLDIVDPMRYPSGGLSPEHLVEMRRLKARMESERLPRGADRSLNTKLGPGGLSDVEWVVQQMQLQHAHAHEALRVPQTLPALRACCAEGLMAQQDAQVLETAWVSATRMRNAVMLGGGRASDQVPTDPTLLRTVGHLLGHGEHEGQQMVDDYRRAARRARLVVKRLFYGG